MSAPVDIVEVALISGTISLFTALPFAHTCRSWGVGVEKRIEAAENSRNDAPPAPAGPGALLRAREDGRAEAFEEAAQHLFGLKGQALPADDLLPIAARFFRRSADRARGWPHQQSSFNSAAAALIQQPPRLVAAARDALKAYRAIFGPGCWNARDQRAFAELEAAIHEAQS